MTDVQRGKVIFSGLVFAVSAALLGDLTDLNFLAWLACGVASVMLWAGIRS